MRIVGGRSRSAANESRTAVKAAGWTRKSGETSRK